MKIFITGLPGCGKTFLIRKIVEEFKDKIKISGFFTEEIREKGKRIGFKIVDISTGKSGILAGIDIKGPKISKYGVNLKALKEIGIKAIRKESQLVVIDEIGAMELLSEKFREEIKNLMNSNKNLLATLHRKYVKEYGKYGILIHLRRENWKTVFKDIKEKILKTINF